MAELPRFDLTSEAPDAPVVGRLALVGPRALGPGNEIDEDLARLQGFTGKLGETLQTARAGRIDVVVGLGDSLTALSLRRAAASLTRVAGTSDRLAIDLRRALSESLFAEAAGQAIVEGVGGAAYRFDRYRSEPKPERIETVVIAADEESRGSLEEGLKRGRAVAEAVNFARDLCNAGAGDLTPRVLAEEASRYAEKTGVRIEVLDEKAVARERLGGLLGVARGSAEPPRLVTMTYEPESTGPGTPTVVFVGKGITFDSGGLSLKPAEGMIGMKGDMSGAAAVLAAIGACRALGVTARVVAIAPTTENMPSGTATKPGDVLRTRNGKTIEVLNTDAEGRLVLSDGLALAAERDPVAILDVATLTGACVVALGGKVAGVMGNDASVVRAVEEAGERAGERFWRLPLPREYRKDIDSEIADMKNIGKAREAGALVAGLLLAEFVDDHPWAHLDIAGPAWADEERFELTKGGTGFAVRTLLEFAQAFPPSEVHESKRADHKEVGE